MNPRTCVLCGSDIVSSDIRDQACDDCYKNKLMDMMKNDLDGIPINQITEYQIEWIADRLIRKGWRKWKLIR